LHLVLASRPPASHCFTPEPPHVRNKAMVPLATYRHRRNGQCSMRARVCLRGGGEHGGLLHWDEGGRVQGSAAEEAATGAAAAVGAAAKEAALFFLFSFFTCSRYFEF